jgi:asparagine synthase (glutamine-hydrolysing)
MCGLAGIMHFEGATRGVDVELLQRMINSLIHRGPDGSGSWVSAKGDVGLAHRRLAIVDLSESAAQPMATQDGRYILTFNGEIYNHAELRRELISLGCTHWQTDHSDTEVVLQAFATWGIDFVDQLRGMFAIALWDTVRRELCLIRDRVGIKPLYYTVRGNRLLFASEIKALLQDPSVDRRIDERALVHYLSFLVTPAPMTLFDGISKLPPGCWLRFSSDGTCTEHRYWDPWSKVNPLKGVSDAELAELVLAELTCSVQLRAMADVPVGIFLSGGVDSSTNAALFAQQSPGRVKTFSVGYREKCETYRNEFEYARFMARQIDAEHHERHLSAEDVLLFLDRMVWHQDEPLADPVCVPVYYVSELARRQGVKVAQVGEGADELFWGYPAWKTWRRVQQLDNIPSPRFIKRGLLSALASRGRTQSRYYEWLRRSCAGQPVFWGGAERFSLVQKEQLLSSTVRQRLGGVDSWDVIEPMWRRFRESAWETSVLNWMSYVDLNYRLPELLLMRVDKMSMAVGLEARVPFLDHKLVELALSIPEAVKTRRGESKHLLKKSVRGLIPDRLIDRRKQGFGLPVYEYLFQEFGQVVANELRQFCKQTDLLNPTYVEQLIQRNDAGGLWLLFNLALWWRRFIAGDPIADAALTMPQPPLA